MTISSTETPSRIVNLIPLHRTLAADTLTPVGILVAARREGLKGFLLESVEVSDPPVEALAAEHAQLDLGDVEPATVLGGEMNLELVGEPLGLGGGEGLVE